MHGVLDDVKAEVARRGEAVRDWQAITNLDFREAANKTAALNAWARERGLRWEELREGRGKQLRIDIRFTR